MKTNDFASVLGGFECDRLRFFCSVALWFRLVVFGFDGVVGVDGLRESFLVPRLRCPEVGLGLSLWLQNRES